MVQNPLIGMCPLVLHWLYFGNIDHVGYAQFDLRLESLDGPTVL